MTRSVHIFVIALALASAGPVQAAAIDRDQLISAIGAAAVRQLPRSVVAVEVQDVVPQGTLDLPEGKPFELRVQADGNEDWVGKTQVEVDIRAEGRSLQRLRVLADIVVYIEVPVLQRSLSRGELITASDIGMVRREVGRLPAGILRQPGDLVGRKLRRDLGLNNTVRESDLAERVDARRNRAVTLVVSRKGLLITAPGLLRKDARIGDLVEVVSTSTGTVVFGILVSPDLVELPSAGSVSREALHTAIQSGSASIGALVTR